MLKWKLVCNGVTVAQIINMDHEGQLFRVGMWGVASGKLLKEENARRAINRKFCLPDDFGAFKARRPRSKEVVVAKARAVDHNAAGAEVP